MTQLPPSMYRMFLEEPRPARTVYDIPPVVVRARRPTLRALVGRLLPGGRARARPAAHERERVAEDALADAA
jgi:hypothetical protein